MHEKKPHTLPPYIIYGFFILGLISAIAFRAIILFQKFEPTWVRPVWYIGAIGYLFFFLYRFSITKKRKRAIDQHRLIEKIRENSCLTNDERDAVAYLLSSIKKSLEDLNYFIIFILSIAAIVLDLLLS
ncbi:hypothetical protein BMS3Abin08_01452 [bacterium BMS3Abin08]|nr:hypothetical protein BMS3Abin08_01452 [bacterium BMS3Abin08]